MPGAASAEIATAEPVATVDGIGGRPVTTLDGIGRLPAGSPTIRGEWACALVSGVSPPQAFEELCQTAHIPAGLLCESLCRVPTELVGRVLDHAAARASDPIAGLRAIAGRRASCFFRHLLAAQPDVRTALEQIERLGDLGLGGVTVDVSLSRQEGSVTLSPRPEPGTRPVLEACLLYLLQLLRETAGPALQALEVGLCGDPRAGQAEYDGVFRAPVRFGRPVFTLVLDHRALDLAMPRANPFVARRLEDLALLERKLLSCTTNGERVAAILRESLAAGESASLAEVARRLVCAPRHLGRLLRAEGASFRDLEQDARRELAIALVAAGAEKLEAAAVRCGFSNVPSFSRAFKRWTGVAPSAFPPAPSGVA